MHGRGVPPRVSGTDCVRLCFMQICFLSVSSCEFKKKIFFLLFLRFGFCLGSATGRRSLSRFGRTRIRGFSGGLLNEVGWEGRGGAQGVPIWRHQTVSFAAVFAIWASCCASGTALHKEVSLGTSLQAL